MFTSHFIFLKWARNIVSTLGKTAIETLPAFGRYNRRSSLAKYLVIEGHAGEGIQNMDCGIWSLPECDEELVRILSECRLNEQANIDIDRQHARSKALQSDLEISHIPDRVTGLNIWICKALEGAPFGSSASMESAWSKLVSSGKAPDVIVSAETLKDVDAIVRAVRPLCRMQDDARTNLQSS